MKMRIRAIAIAMSVLSAGGALGQGKPARVFGFQEVLLDMHISRVPDRFKADCGSGGNTRFLFCTYATIAGAVPLTIELSFRDEKVTQIQAYFPSEHYQTVWLALREKWGKEDRRSAERVEWFSNPMVPDQPIPDELILRAKPADSPRPDGRYYFPAVEYSVIEYQSLAAARDDMRKSQERRDRDVKGVADKL